MRPSANAAGPYELCPLSPTGAEMLFPNHFENYEYWTGCGLQGCRLQGKAKTSHGSISARKTRSFQFCKFKSCPHAECTTRIACFVVEWEVVGVHPPRESCLPHTRLGLSLRLRASRPPPHAEGRRILGAPSGSGETHINRTICVFSRTVASQWSVHGSCRMRAGASLLMSCRATYGNL